jgi:hypothetical protein
MFGEILAAASSLLGPVTSIFSGKRSTSQQNRGNAQAQEQLRAALEMATKNAKPFMEAGRNQLPDLQRTGGLGADALAQLANLYGGAGAGAQKKAVVGMQSSPLFQQAQAQGRNNILNAAAATGGLRGGNTEAALAQLGPELTLKFMDAMRSGLTPVAELGTQAQAHLSDQSVDLTQLLSQLGFNTAVGTGAIQQQIGLNQAGRTVNNAGNFANIIGQGFNALSGLTGAGGGSYQGFNPKGLNNTGGNIA